MEELKSFQLGILKHVQRGDLMTKSGSLYPIPKPQRANNRKPYLGLYKVKVGVLKGEGGWKGEGG